MLGFNPFLKDEWKSQFSDGKVDFYIESVKWAIECDREGDRLHQYITKFRPGGIYYPMIASREIQDYILLDFRTSKPDNIRGMFASSPGLTNAD